MSVIQTLFNEFKPSAGWFQSNLIIWNKLEKGGYVSKGFKVEFQDNRAAANEVKNRYHEKINSFLRMMYQTSGNIRIQIGWSVDSDYKQELLAYDADTEKYAKNKWTYKTRKERFNRYWNMVKKRDLRKEKCYIYISLPILDKVKKNISGNDQLVSYDIILKNLGRTFNNIHTKMISTFGGDIGNVEITPMTDKLHFLHIFEYFHPGFHNRSLIDPYKNLLLYEKSRRDELGDPHYCWQEESIYKICCSSGIKGNKKRKDDCDFGFYQDGNYHDIIMLERWGTSTYPCQFYELTSLDILDYRITVNIYPVPLSQARSDLKKSIKRLRTEMRENESDEDNLISIETKRNRLFNYGAGVTFPFEVHYIIHVWDTDQTRLAAKVNSIKSTIETLSGANFYEIGRPEDQIQFRHIATPGWLFNSKKDYRIPAENTYLSDRLPISSTYTGLLKGAEAIYDGAMNNLIGVKNFINGTPQMFSVFGMSGSGKSATMVDLFSQTECFYDFTCIVEEGNSYGTWVKLMNEETLMVDPSGEFTINYFDTRKIPLANNFISGASALVAKMCGTIQDEDKMRVRRAMITHYIQSAYNDSFQEWSRNNENLIPEIARNAISVNKYWKQFMSKNCTKVEGWVEFKEKFKEEDSRALEVYDKVSEEEISRFIQTQKSELRNTAHAWYKPEDYPTHSHLCDVIATVPDTSQHSEEEIKKVLTILNQWRADRGDSGKIFDGVDNIELTRKIAHFELGMIPESADYMKPVVTFLVNNMVRNHILTLPRGSKKRMIFEEAGRLLAVEGGEKIISEGYAQFRKFNCLVTTIIQQYEKFKKSNIRATIIGNCKQYILLAQRDRADINDMGTSIYMPGTLRDSLSEYPQPEKAHCACFTYWTDDIPRPKYGTVKNIVSKEMLYVASTKGEDIEKRERELKVTNGDLADAITVLANKDNNREEVA